MRDGGIPRASACRPPRVSDPVAPDQADALNPETIMQEQVIGIGHNNPPSLTAPVPWLAGRRALIRRRGRPVETAGRARADEWVLTFEHGTPPEIDDIMGWTGGEDTLATEVRLTFATQAEAVAYAERQGLDVDAAPEPARTATVAAVPPWRWNRRPAAFLGRPIDASPRPQAVDAADEEPIDRGGLPDLERAFVNPAAVFAMPRDVLDHPRLLRGCKREILRRWAWDEYLKEVAAAEGMAEGEASRLDEVRAALLCLEETWRPKPFAPAARVPHLTGEAELAA
ncbi:NADH dehydrogenase ubiquinone Fe-S protein 4 [Methylobacterium sp. ID0610]|uniref:NADH dehydrogenase ubiquinone Fe-S protein 4 n=1 Tax=Methylobacterium carpenticola TaxID=3344827 RepID=UPI00369EC847